mgnify:CR=1 FL=1
MYRFPGVWFLARARHNSTDAWLGSIMTMRTRLRYHTHPEHNYPPTGWILCLGLGAHMAAECSLELCVLPGPWIDIRSRLPGM